VRLATILHRLSTEDRNAILATHRLAEETSVGRLAQHLVQSRVLLNQLRTELRPVTNLIERLAVFGPSAGLDDDILGGVPSSRLLSAQHKGLLFLLPSTAEPTEVVLPLEYMLMREIRRPPSTDLISGLRVLGVDHLRLVARMLGLQEQRSTPLLMGDLHDHLTAQCRELAASLEPGERAVLDALLERGGVVDASVFHREHPLVPSTTAHGPFTMADVLGLGRNRGRPTAAQRLFQRGLFHAATEKDAPGGAVVQVYVPAELVERLSSAWIERRASEEAEIRKRAVLTEAPDRVRNAIPDVRGTLRAFSLAVEACGFGFIQGGEPRRDHTEAVSRLRRLTDREQELLAVLGRLMGIFRTSENRLLLTPETAARLDAPPGPFLEDLLDAVTSESGAEDALRPRLRRLILGRLSRFEGDWVRVTELPGLLRTDPEYRRTMTVHAIHPDTETADLKSLIEELRVWGFVDLAGDAGDATAVRHRRPAPAEAPEVPRRPLTVPPNLEVVVPLAAPFSLLLQLCRFAEPQVLDVAAVFKLTEASLARGSARGVPPDRARGFLADHCSHTLPDPVERLIDDVLEREGEVRIIRTSGVLALKDPVMAEALQDHPEIGPTLNMRLGPGVFALDPEVDPEDVQALLRKHGFFSVLA